MNLEHLRRIAGELGVPVQYGGGLRSAQAVADALDAGAERVILGTAAFTDPDLLRTALAGARARAGARLGGRARRARDDGRLDGDDRDARPRLIARLREQGVRRARVHERRPRRHARRARPGGSRGRGGRGGRASLIYSGGIGELADLEGLASLPSGRQISRA